MKHRATRRILSAGVIAVGAILLLSCAAARPERPHRGMEKIWAQFLKLPMKRAMALSGDPSRTWVAGSSGGHGVQLDADESALDECRRRRGERRLQASCRIYARGSKIVWDDW